VLQESPPEKTGVGGGGGGGFLADGRMGKRPSLKKRKCLEQRPKIGEIGKKNGQTELPRIQKGEKTQRGGSGDTEKRKATLRQERGADGIKKSIQAPKWDPREQ